MPTPPAPAWISTVSPGLQVTELEEAVVGGAERDRHARDRDDVGAVGHRPRERSPAPRRARRASPRGSSRRRAGRRDGRSRPRRPRGSCPRTGSRRCAAPSAISPPARLSVSPPSMLIASTSMSDAAGVDHGIGDVLVAEHLGRTGLVVHGSFHGPDATTTLPARRSVPSVLAWLRGEEHLEHLADRPLVERRTRAAAGAAG